MVRPSNREEALERIKQTIQGDKIVFGAGTGVGMSARYLERGGADFICIYNSCDYHLAGRGALSSLMPYGNANDLVKSMGTDILAIVKNIPVIAGVCASDPSKSIDTTLEEMKTMGFAGVQNFPTVGLADGTFRDDLEATGMGYPTEVRMIRFAKEKGLFTLPYVFGPEDARAMAEAGADGVIAHMGLPHSIPKREENETDRRESVRRESKHKTQSLGVKHGKSLDEAVEAVEEILNAAKKVNPEIIVLVHGGPIYNAEDCQTLLAKAQGIDGFYGPHEIERAAADKPIQKKMEEFKGIKQEVLTFI